MQRITRVNRTVIDFIIGHHVSFGHRISKFGINDPCPVESNQNTVFLIAKRVFEIKRNFQHGKIH